MADNSSLPVASGNEVFANDDISGVKYPRPKINWGPDGVANDVDVASGKMLPIQLRHSDGTVISDATGIKISTASQVPLGPAAIAASMPMSLATDHSAILIGMKSSSSLSAETPVATGLKVDAAAGVDRVLITRPHANLEDLVSGLASVSTATQTTCIAAQAAGIRTYVTSVVLCNTSASPVTVNIGDGGTAKATLPVPAGSGCIFNPPAPLRGTAATAWTFTPSGAAATVTCTMLGFKSKV